MNIRKADLAINHYVSQLIIRRFSNRKNIINIFSVQEKRVVENKKSVSIFCKKGIYSDDVEEKLNKNLENPFAKLLDSKIIDQDIIRLDREELLLLKKYMMIDSVKTLAAKTFKSIMSGFHDNVNRYLNLNKILGDLLLNNMVSMTKFSDTDEEFFDRALHVLIESSSIYEIAMHPSSCVELYVWAKVFLDGYVAFWDSNNNQEFILTDNGMTSEYEPSHMVFEGLSHSKISYMLDKVQKSTKEETLLYADLLSKSTILYENFNIFNITSSRSVVLINPFFRLYSTEGQMINDVLCNPKIPDIWPSFMGTTTAFNTPKNEYKIPGHHTMKDIFIYKPITLSLNDTIYINTLLLSQTNNLIGFVSFDKIADSLMCHIGLRAVNNKEVYSNDYTKNFMTLINSVMNDEYGYIFRHFKDYVVKPEINPIDFLDHYAEMCINDTRNNIYALNYLLKNEHLVRSMKNFDFMGAPDVRIKLIKEDIERLTTK